MVNSSKQYRDKVSQLISWGHWFCLSNIILALIVGLRYLVLATPPETFLGQSYLIVSWLGQFSFIAFVIFLLTLFPLSFVIPSNRSLRFVGALFATIGLSLLIVDTEVFATFNLHLNPALLELLVDEEQNSQANTLNLLFVSVPFIFLLELWLAKLCWKYLRRLEHKRLGGPIAGVLFICFLLTHFVHAWADATNYTTITRQKNNYPLFYPLTARSFLQEQGIFDVDAYYKQIKAQEQEQQGQLRYPISPLKYDQVEQRYNLMLVVVEGLRWDMLNQQAMPNSWKQAKRSSQFFSHHSGSNKPQEGLFSLFYGIPTSYWPSFKTESQGSVLVSALQDSNYQIELFSSRGLNLPELAGTSFSALSNLDMTKWPGGAAGDEKAIQEWLIWQQSQYAQLPWFNFLYLNGVAAYDNGSGETMSEVTPESLSQHYSDAATVVDSQLNKVYQQLAQSGQLERTILVVTSDYGNELNDGNSNYWGNNSNFSRYQTQVPLFISWPDKNPSLLHSDTSHNDVVPTLLEEMLAVASNSANYSTGQNLFKKRKRDWILIGNQEQQAVVQRNQITLFNQSGSYRVLDRDLKSSNARVSVPMLVQVLNDLKRFYQPQQ
ncbi:DUF3413 domain-containing protein [Agarivorans sp. B2Z047]|uniref:DUF3413 domain-containing protein n=1 Tax=Agarivorans sp. B2Z047 TaxID=2652721 RepID=UPI00128E3815|nr:DUF3413 domain-containing protein [Agarivorans sp. B2Z047]MPW28544.1 DUF3413 domain-containing protein [Agarivorans sp. B2Z047]UQN41105.1 DUF3413 domain-containing protein [Agarivorans sp. B2Z047]